MLCYHFVKDYVKLRNYLTDAQTNKARHPLLPYSAICGCIAKMPLSCASKKLSESNISEAELEYVQITHVITHDITME